MQKTNLWLPKRKGWGEDKLGVGLTDTYSIYKIDKQQGPAV